MTEAERTIDTPDPAARGSADVPGETPVDVAAAGKAASSASSASSGPGAPAASDGRAPAEADADTPGTSSPDATTAASEGTASATERRRRVLVLAGVAAFAYVLDLVSKIVVVAKLEPRNASVEVLGEVLKFHAVRNPGAAFGIGEALTIVFTIIAAVVIVVIARIARKLHSTPWAVALGLLLGGAFGNLTDRIFRSPGVFEGHVVDFIAPAHFAVFNLADSAIVCGGVLIVVLSFRGIDPDGTVHR